MKTLDDLLFDEKVIAVLDLGEEILPSYMRHHGYAVENLFELHSDDSVFKKIYTIAETYEHCFNDRMPKRFLEQLMMNPNGFRYARYFIFISRFEFKFFHHFSEVFDLKELVEFLDYHKCFTFKIKVGNKTTNNLEKAKGWAEAGPNAEINITVRFNRDALPE